MKKNLLTSCRSLFIAAALLAGFTACSDDDEPAVLSGISTNANAFDLDREGNAVIEFTVEPADAEVSSVNVALNSGATITPSGLSRASEGVWRATVKVDDVSRFGASQTGTLTALQADGTSAQASFVLADPFCVPEGAFTAHYPFTVNYCDAATHTAMRMPVILSAEGASLNDIAESKLFIENAQPALKGSDFVFGTNGTGEYGIFLKQETVDGIVAENPQQYFTVVARMEFTMNTGRIASVPLHFMFAAPQCTYRNSEKLTFNTADIKNPDYQSKFELNDVIQNWRRIGFYDGEHKDFAGASDFSEYGFYRTDGTRVDDGDFFFSMPDLKESDYISIEGNASYIYEPGTYYYVYHVKADWEYNGKKYERIRADFRYEVTLK